MTFEPTPVEIDGEVLADSSRPYLLFETALPARYHLPPEDVRLDRLTPSPTASTCAYKGEASYWALDGRDIAWLPRAAARGGAGHRPGRVLQRARRHQRRRRARRAPGDALVLVHL